MNLVLARIDDRLVHGQVVQGCCGPLSVRRILLANDEAAEDALQTRLYRSAAPPGLEVIVLSVEDGARRLQEWRLANDGIVTLLVVESPGDLLQLVDAGVTIPRINLGGLHHHAGTRELWPGFFLDAPAIADLREMLGRGIEIEVRTVPGAVATDARALLEAS